jgi:type VI protein secretion system component VasF
VTLRRLGGRAGTDRSQAMDRTEEIVSLLREIRDIHREAAKSQQEALAFMRAQAEETKARVDRSISLQEVSVQRQKGIQWIALPVIVICLGLVAYLLFKYGL